ncbi:hypothetical protein AYM40_04795 [Paraburkholderia phytofirmans OLGA172]|uniref:FAD-binding FR-type domain-containing protein n=1 Tax=Paraburkholderia phytofirmans OLGA172 TaxID=1417228 RepID=A0A167VUD8_9BURK|nr:ferredoxin reductase [Paraburkholderia phytofirmans]ANB71767.1 hypothetical protein AYM40_04795 [Paraburkholderia phytofirmans OLGA172]
MLTVKVTSKTVVADGICSFELTSAEGVLLPAFSAGSHIEVHLPGGLIRQYSLCNNPDENHRYVIGVLKDPGSRGGSVAMHELMEGAEIVIGEPKNHFALARHATHSILVAGGIGITPLLCMAKRLVNEGASFELHYCARTLDKIAFKERFRLHDLVSNTFLHLDDHGDSQQFNTRATFSRSADPGTHVYRAP